MLTTCPYCGGELPGHGECCRVPDDLDRFERVSSRLASDHHNDYLLTQLRRHLTEFGRLPESGRIRRF